MIIYVMVLNLVFLTLSGISVMGETTRDLSNDSYIPSQQLNVSDPAPLKLFFYGDSADLKPEVPMSNSTTEIACEGHPIPRYLGYYIGTWTTSPLTMPVIIENHFAISLWVYSQQSAKNVRFNVQIRVNGNERYSFQTESMSLSQTPTEIRGEGNHESSLELLAGDTFSVRLAYFSDPARFVGPGADSVLIVGSDEYDTHLEITTSPMSLSTNPPVINLDIVTFSATFIDAFSASRYHAHIMIDGEVDVVSISEPVFTMADNGSLVSWNWNFKADKGRDGDYMVFVSLCYGDENDFKASGEYFLEFHEHEEEPGIIESLGLLFPIIIIAIIAVILVIVVRRIRSRRAENLAV
jgi:hypothetical protein